MSSNHVAIEPVHVRRHQGEGERKIEPPEPVAAAKFRGTALEVLIAEQKSEHQQREVSARDSEVGPHTSLEVEDWSYQ